MTLAKDVVLGVVIVAAGSGERFGDAAKVFSPLAGRPVLEHSLELFQSVAEVRQIMVVLGGHTIEAGRALIRDREYAHIGVCLGGDTRSDSVRAGLRALHSEVDLVAVHDAGRPLASLALARRVIAAARVHGAAVPLVPVQDTLVRVDRDRQVTGIEPREQLGAVQTPQVARRDWLEAALDTQQTHTDESGALLAAGFRVVTVEGCPDNIKLTWPTDLALAEAILHRRQQ